MQPIAKSVLTHADGRGSLAKLAAAPDAFTEAVDAWLTHLVGIGRSEATADAWRSMIMADRRELGVSSPDQIDYQTVGAGLSGLRVSHGWSDSTLRCHLSAWKSLHKHLARIRSGDLQAAEGPREIEPGDGARAATPEEARALLAASWGQESGDGRSRSSRTLYFAMLFLAGCREDDHWHLRWEHLRLDDPVPHIRWPRALNKNRRLMHVALCPELVDLLREHRASMKKLSESVPTVCRKIKDPLRGWVRARETRRVERSVLPLDPDLPGSPVFGWKPPRDVFRADVARAGIERHDERGRPFSPHSGRKAFKTWLISLGVSREMSEHLMRHSPKIEGRYFDPTLTEQRAALSKLPRVWPQTQVTHGEGFTSADLKIFPNSVDCGWVWCDGNAASPMLTTSTITKTGLATLPTGGHGLASRQGWSSGGHFASPDSRFPEVPPGALASVMSDSSAQALTRSVADVIAAVAVLMGTGLAGWEARHVAR